MKKLLVASIASIIALGCTRVQTYSLEGVEYLGSGRFSVLLQREVVVHYPFALHERSSNLETSYELFLVEFDRSSRRYRVSVATPDRKRSRIYRALEPGVPREIEVASRQAAECVRNPMYRNWSRVSTRGSVAELCDGTLTVRREGGSTCSVDLASYFFREGRVPVDAGGQRYPIRIQKSGDFLIAHVSFDGSMRHDDIYRAWSSRLRYPIGTLIAIGQACELTVHDVAEVESGSYIRSIGLESPSAIMVENIDSARGLILREGRTSLQMSPEQSALANLTSQPNIDSLFLDDYSKRIIQMGATLNGPKVGVVSTFDVAK